jgi:hypothetical protein
MKKMIFARSPAGIYVHGDWTIARTGDDACSVWYVHHMDKAVNEPTFRTLEQGQNIMFEKSKE